MAKDKKGQKESAQESKAPEQARHSAKERPRLRARFEKEVAPALLKELELNNVMAVPRLHKIVVNMIRGFEGGQMPLHRRMPKRGFTNIFRKEFNIVSLERLAELGETTINPDVLRKAGVIKTKHPVKILGDGQLTVALTVSAHKFSKSAQEKITKAGGKVEVLQ